MKNILKAFTVFLVVLCLLQCRPFFAFADATDELYENIEQGINDIDFSAFQQIEGAEDIADKIKAVLNGEFEKPADYLRLIADVFVACVGDIVPTLSLLVAICVIISLVSSANSGFISHETNNVVLFVGMASVLVTTLVIVKSVYGETLQVIDGICALSDASMPILLTFVVANGGNVASSLCTPAVVLFSGGIISLVKNVVLPLSLFAVILGAVSSLSEKVRVSKMSTLFSHVSSWMLGFMFMVFSAFLTVQGISAKTFDGISVRVGRFAAKNYVPILGSYLADGFDIILASTSLIKNAFGGVVLIILLLRILRPVVTCVAVNLGLQLVSATVEPVADKRFLDFLSCIGKSLTFWAVAIIAVAFMFLVIVLVAMCSANVV